VARASVAEPQPGGDHIHDDYVLSEVLDIDSGKLVGPGEQGEEDPDATQMAGAAAGQGQNPGQGQEDPEHVDPPARTGHGHREGPYELERDGDKSHTAALGRELLEDLIKGRSTRRSARRAKRLPTNRESWRRTSDCPRG